MDTRTLTIQQEQAVNKFKNLRVGALFMACGTGKTQTAVKIINSIKDEDLFIYLAPCRTINNNLDKELKNSGLEKKPDIIGIESLISDKLYLNTLERIKIAHKPILICDESLKIKNISAQRTKKILELSKYAYYKLILNGTPITKNIIDIYTQMEFLSPKILNCTLSQFKRRYCILGQKKIGGRIVKEFVKGEANVEHLFSIIKPYIFQCDLELNVNKKHYYIDYSIDLKSKEEYLRIKEMMMEDIKYSENEDIGIKICGYFQKMQHIYSCTEEKFKLVEKYMTENTIVFCKFIKSKEELQKRFPNLLVLTYGKDSLGLNLQQYNKIIFFDKTFDYAFVEQSEYRIFRIGQKENCEYYHFTGIIGLETIFDDCINKKITLVECFKKIGKSLFDFL